jgi:hypothetical protein
LTMVRPGRPKMSPMKRIRMIAPASRRQFDNQLKT